MQTLNKHKRRNQTIWKPLIRGAASGAAVLIVSVLILTATIYLGWVSETAIPIGNIIIKILSALAAGIVTGIGRERAPWFFGGFAAVICLALSVALMSVYLGSFRLNWNLLADLLLCFAVGCASSTVFLRRKQA